MNLRKLIFINNACYKAGRTITLNTPGKHLSSDISGYSIVVFGSPNYGGSPGEALLNYMKRIEDFTGSGYSSFLRPGAPKAGWSLISWKRCFTV